MLAPQAESNRSHHVWLSRVLFCGTLTLVGASLAQFAHGDDLRNATLRPATPAAGSCCQGQRTVRTQPPAAPAGCSCCQGARTAHADDGNLPAARRSVQAANASARAGAVWRDRKAPHRIQFDADMAHDIRLVMFEMDADASIEEIKRAFLTNARAYQHQNVSWSFDRSYSYNRTALTRQLIVGWRNETTGEYGYVALDPVDVRDDARFTWTDSRGAAHEVDESGWQATNWAVVRNPADDGPDFFIGLQMGRQAGNDEMQVVFRPQYLEE